MEYDRVPWWSMLITRDYRALVVTTSIQLIVLPVFAVWFFLQAVETGAPVGWFATALTLAAVGCVIYGAVDLWRFKNRRVGVEEELSDAG